MLVESQSILSQETSTVVLNPTLLPLQDSGANGHPLSTIPLLPRCPEDAALQSRLCVYKGIPTRTLPGHKATTQEMVINLLRSGLCVFSFPCNQSDTLIQTLFNFLSMCIQGARQTLLLDQNPRTSNYEKEMCCHGAYISDPLEN